MGELAVYNGRYDISLLFRRAGKTTEKYPVGAQ